MNEPFCFPTKWIILIIHLSNWVESLDADCEKGQTNELLFFLDKQFKCFRCQSSGCIYSLFSLLRFHHLLRFEAMGQGVFKCASIGRFSLLLSFMNCLNCFGISQTHKWVNRSVHLHPLKRAPWLWKLCHYFLPVAYIDIKKSWWGQW